MKIEPQEQHRWLQRLVGEWVGEQAEGAQHAAWTESVRSLHGLWVVAEGRGEMPGGGSATSIMTLGYDPQKDRFVGTWVGSMMTHLWVYEGTLDASGNVLTLDTVGPAFSDKGEPIPGKMTKYQDVIEFLDDGRRRLRGRMLGDDGNWQEFMVTTYRRQG